MPEEARKERQGASCSTPRLAAEQVAHRLILGKRLKDASLPIEEGSAKERAEKNLKLYLRRLLSQGTGSSTPDDRDLEDL